MIEADICQLNQRKAEDQLKHVRMQNDALRVQAESKNEKGSYHLYPPAPHPPLPHKRENTGLGMIPLPTTRPIDFIFEYVIQNLPKLIEFLPTLIKTLVGYVAPRSMDPDPERAGIKPDRNGEIAREKVKRKGKG
jgi:hypothetical protein